MGRLRKRLDGGSRGREKRLKVEETPAKSADSRAAVPTIPRIGKKKSPNVWEGKRVLGTPASCVATWESATASSGRSKKKKRRR